MLAPCTVTDADPVPARFSPRITLSPGTSTDHPLLFFSRGWGGGYFYRSALLGDFYGEFFSRRRECFSALFPLSFLHLLQRFNPLYWWRRRRFWRGESKPSNRCLSLLLPYHRFFHLPDFYTISVFLHHPQPHPSPRLPHSHTLLYPLSH